ncbi:MAG: hypothetical protein NC398_07690 [Acetatifactor muris]|nr:hypothetical protein [Acetatifactor muris]MCM1527292.1 hypothetical protein [Bacteroides sp.]
MQNILSSLVVAVVTSVLSIIGTLYVQKRKSENATKKNALYLYLNLKQIKSDIDKEKKIIDGTSWDEILPMAYFTPFDYIGVLSELNDKLSLQEMVDINNFYENVKKIDNKKMNYINLRYSYNNFSNMNPPQILNPYYQQFIEMQNAFTYALNVFVNSEEYKENIVKIISKLEKIKK